MNASDVAAFIHLKMDGILYPVPRPFASATLFESEAGTVFGIRSLFAIPLHSQIAMLHGHRSQTLR